MIEFETDNCFLADSETISLTVYSKSKKSTTQRKLITLLTVTSAYNAVMKSENTTETVLSNSIIVYRNQKMLRIFEKIIQKYSNL